METAVKEEQVYPELVLEKATPVSSEKNQLSQTGIKSIWYRITHWETWDWRIKYLLIGPAWLWFCVRARSPWFFTAANPTLTFGGFDGERKSEMYAQLPPETLPKSIYNSPSLPLEHIAQKLDEEGLRFPLAVKPDAGKMGLMFRKINSHEELKAYHEKMFCDYIIQEWISYPLEVSIFYYRMPGVDKGKITGFVRKDFMEVTGDGRSTLWDLIVQHPRAKLRLAEMRSKHSDKLEEIIRAGEKYCLSPALNLSRGGKLVSLEHEKDERLLEVFDRLSHYTGSFYYGRYDVKCNSIEELKQGKKFSILEYNGSGAEPHHVYGNGNTVFQACSILVAHWNILCRISRINHKAGIRYWSLVRGWKFVKNSGRHFSALRKLDAQTRYNQK